VKERNYIYRRPVGKRPRVGNPADAVPGDIVTYFDEGRRYTTREVQEVFPGKSVMVTAPLVSPYGKLADSASVKFEDIDDIIRPNQAKASGPEPESPPDPPPKPSRSTKRTIVINNSASGVDIRAPGAALRPDQPGYRKDPT